MKKKWGLILLAVLLVIFAIFYFTNQKNDKPETLFNKENIEFWILSDPHYFYKSLTDSGEAYTKIKQTAAGKELDYQAESWQALIDNAIKQKPDMLIVTGDLTLNGEKVSAEKLAELLKQLSDQGIKVFVIPGNHDVNDGWARKFVGDKQEKTDAISIADFKEIFADCGYQGATNYDPNSLSYSVAVNQTYDFLFLDSNIYTEDGHQLTRPTTGGTIRGRTMNWAKKQLEKSRQAKKKTLVFMHHNLYPHNEMLSNGFVLNNAEEFRQVLAGYQVQFVFSGHIHAQDIMTETIDEQPITEIVSSSFAIAPQSYGVVNLTNTTFDYQKKENNVDLWAKENNITNPDILNYKKYMKEIFVEDGRKLGYAQLIEAGMEDGKELDIAADFVGEMNYRFFSGNDYSSDEEVKQLKSEQGYQIIAKYSPFLKEYLDSIMQDKNEADNQLSKDY